MSNEMISVTRELAELCMRNLNGGDNQLTGMEHGRAFRELRALLAKPVVERRPFGYWLTPKTCAGLAMFQRELIEDPVLTKSVVEYFHVTPLYDEPSTQHQGEPVYMVRTHGSCCWEEVGSGSLEDFQSMPEEYELRALYTRPAEQPAPVAMVMSFDFEHPLSKERRTVTLTKRNVFDGMEDYFYDKLGAQICQCESVGETNVVDCNCDEYVHDFEIMQACLDEVARLNPPQQ